MYDDIRYAFRNLLRTPGFTAVAIASLALGIGANSAIFTLLDQVMLRSLPVKAPQDLVMLNLGGPFSGTSRNNDTWGYPLYLDLRDHNEAFSGMAGRVQIAASVMVGDNSERSSGDLVTGNYFEVLGVEPAIGRLLTPEDDKAIGGNPVVVLSHDYWTRKFGASAGVLNQVIRINGHPMTVIGVTAEGFKGMELGNAPDFMVPMSMKREMTPGWFDLDRRNSRWMVVFARLKPGMTREKAQASINSTYQGYKDVEYAAMGPNQSQRFRERFMAHQITLESGAQGKSYAQRDMAKPLRILMVMVGVVLLIACGNVANLLLARAAGRQKEIAVRLALGASRTQIMRQLIIESLVLSLVGGMAGLLVSSWTAQALLQLMSRATTDTSLTGSPDARILGFTIALSVLTGLAFGLVPALKATNPNVAPTLKDQAGNVSATGAHVRLRKGLVIAQVVLSLVLLIGAGLFGRSLYNLKTLDYGFRSDRLMQFSVDPALSGYKREQWAAFAEQMQERVSSIPGVQVASVTSNTPYSGSSWNASIAVEGYKANEEEDTTCTMYFVAPRYFAAMGIPLISGREFTAADRKGGPAVAIVNERFVDHFFKGQNPLGRKFVLGDDRDPQGEWMEIVGVVRDGKQRSLRDKEIPMVFYTPVQQNQNAFRLIGVVRASGDPTQLGQAIRGEVKRLDPNLPLFQMRTLDETINQSLRLERLIAVLSVAFGVLATLLACIGLYGVMAYTVTQRTREIGIRMALGADTGRILGLVMREVLVMAAVGIAIAIPAAVVLSRFVESQLYGIKPADPLTFAASAVFIALVAFLAGFLPARRATQVAPTTALRYE